MTQQISQYSVRQVQEAHQRLTQAQQAFSSGDIESSAETCHELLGQHPDYFGALTLMASIHMQRGHFALALPCLVRASLLNANDGELWCSLGLIYFELNAIPNAVMALERSVSLLENPSVPHHLLGAIALSGGEHELALKHLETSLTLDPSNPGASIRYAICLVSLGRTDAAIEQLRMAYKPNLSDDNKAMVYQLLAESPELDRTLGIIDQIDENGDSAETSNSVEFVPGVSLYAVSRDFAKAAALDLRDQHEQAWALFSVANKQIADAVHDQRENYFRLLDELDAKAEHWRFGPKDLEQPPIHGPTVLFVLGPLHSGMAVAESLVASLDGTEKALQDTFVPDIAQRLSQRAGLLTEYFLADLPSSLDNEISDELHAEISRRAQKADLVSIAHHGTTFDVARLAGLLPNSRFLFIKRNRDDTALRIYFRLYTANTDQFAYDIKDIYRYLEQHDRMADLSAERIGDRALVLPYEDIVSDPLAAAGRVAQLCGKKAPTKLNVEISGDVGCATPYLEWLHDARDKTG